MWQFLFHLWQAPPTDLLLPGGCPPPAAGQAADPQGFFDPAPIIAAFNLSAWVSAILVVLAVVVCYQLARGSLGRRFVRRWWIALVAAAAICCVSTLAILITAPTTALANTCSTNPNAFAVRLPMWLIISRSAVSLVWGTIAFLLLSLVATRLTIGRFGHAKNGFFHNRGCPWPRFQP